MNFGFTKFIFRCVANQRGNVDSPMANVVVVSHDHYGNADFGQQCSNSRGPRRF